MNRKEFPDQPQIERIRERLWSGREFGRASVMVGAGFSKNARGSSPTLPAFPSWGELAGVMYEALYPPDQNRSASWEESKKIATSGAGAMSLASEYEALFGRAALNNLVSSSVPDEKFEPGSLHSLLLSLPWSDVFTTNYDTLLDRARSHPEVYERKYELVLTPADLPLKAKPRIVKLHGSLPSQRPFIITEEDYRTYPVRFAPFVNTVQQAVMENALCLLGFSGDDPNFLNWIGWVRDNLGSSMPPVYLCGLLNLSRSQRQLLSHRNVIPIDLSPLFPPAKIHDTAQRHSMALEWFLQNLTSGEPPKVDGWPERGRSKAREHSRELPAVPTKSDTIPDPGPPLPNDPFSLDLQEVRDIHVAWRNTRGAYPGWIILPAQNRESLWIRTERWIEPVFESVRQFEAPDDLLLLYELNWRLERCMVPLFENWTEKIMDTLNTYNPYPHLLDLESATITPVKTKYAELDWQRLSEAWIGLTFAVARMFREDCKEDKFKAWMERLEPVVSAHSEWKARLVHEHCMFAIARFDQAGARNALSNWPNTEENTLWELRRAAMFAELGEVKESRQIAGRVLSEIRRRSESFSSDRTLLSQEGLTILFLEMLETGDFGLGAEERFRNRDRLERLQTYRCDPRAEINNFEAKIIGLPKPKDSVETTSPSFDPGRETTTTHFASGFIAKESIPAFALLRTAEEGVLLPRVPGVNFFSETALTAARWIEDYAPLWSVSSEIRYGPASKKLYNRFDRVRIATMPQEVVDHVFDILYSPLAQSIEQLQYNAAEAGPGSPSFAMRQALIASELLSRLYFRLSEEQQDKVFVLAASMYGMPLFQTRHWFHDGITSLFKRMLAAETSGNGILRRVPRLLELPIPGENGVDIRLEETWVEPLEHIVWSQEEKFESGLDREAVSPSIERLIRLIRDGTSKIRRRAVTRLNVLHSMGVLTEKEEADFGCALWARRSAVSGLPKDTNFYPHAFLNLEGPEPGRAMEAFRKSIRTRDFLRMTIGGDGENKVISFSLRHANDLYTRDILGATAPRLRDDNDARIYVDWTPEEITAFLQKIVQCWDDEKDELKRVVSEGLDGHFSSIVTQRLEGWLNILARVVLPNIEAADEAGRQTARRLILEMDEAGGPAPLALPALLYVVPEDAEEVAAKIKARIDHNDADEVRAAALGVSLWLEHASADDIPNPPEELLDALIARVVSRKQEAVDVVLISLRAMLQKSPVFFDEARLANLSSALCSLLEDTKLPDYKRREGEDRLGSAIPVELRTRRRCLAAQLAHRLYQEFGRRSIDAPDILERWQKMCSQNPLPEVRRAWS